VVGNIKKGFGDFSEGYGIEGFGFFLGLCIRF
jgi:hypothetical protein